MCETLKMLAQLSEYCYIAQCEHGTLHLRWEHLTVHLTPADFLALNRVVTDALAEHKLHDGRMRLGIGGVTLEFLADDYRLLIPLMRKAAACLNNPTSGHNDCSRSFVFSNVQYLN